jgi:hypothetical protein
MAEDITCPGNCQTPLPPFVFTNCDPEGYLSEIEWLLIKKPGSNPISNVGSLTEWQARVNNAGAGAQAIRQIHVTGDMPAAQDNEVSMSGQRRKVLSRTYTLNFDIDELNDVNHESLRELQCAVLVDFAYATLSGHIFGGGNFIQASLKLNPVHERGESAIQKWTGTLTWTAKHAPKRDLWPLAGISPESSTTFDSILQFVSATTDTEASVTGTVTATDPVKKFEFNAITPLSGTPASMSIHVSGSEVVTIDFTSDYTGQAFRYTHSNGTVYNGVFTNGTVNF